ncbi:MAG: class I SAM-dependent methyltransferase [Gammaproteobacteria bacterium]|nr:MAG: class I SAM-dependent methyltransferase [Gammaproteobacteria bacterium]
MPDESSHSSAHLEAWYQGKNGPYVLASLRRALQPVLDLSFGYHILQMGIARDCPLYEQSTINHRIYSADSPGGAVNLVSHSDELPLESDSIDTLIAHHSLEFGPNPHRVLREMQRVLAPQGHLLIVGVNPYSLLGAGAALRRIARNPLWRAQHPVSRHRLTDWLHLLGCEVQSCSHVYGLPPIGGGKIHDLLTRGDAWSNEHKLPTGGLYVLHAIKQVSALNKPRLRLRERGERLIGLAVPKPSVAPSPAPAVPATTRSIKKSGEAAA